MPDRSPRRNGKPSHEQHTPGLLRYRFSPDPEQLVQPELRDEHTERLEQALRAIWETPGQVRYPPITPETLTNWHRRLLLGLEPDDRVGHFRTYKEQSSCEVWEEAEDGSDDEPRHCVCPGVEVPALGDQKIWEVVREACSTFESSVKAQQRAQSRKINDAVRPCAKLYVALLKARPFSIDNDPVAYLVLHGAYLRTGLQPLIYSPRMPTVAETSAEQDVERVAINLDFNHALARSLQPNGDDLDQLVAFLATHASFR